MHRLAKLTTLLLALVCLATAADARDVSAVAERVKNSVREKSPCWKLNRVQARDRGERQDFEQEWLCGKEGVTVYYYEESSAEAAARLFEELRTSPVQAPGRVVNSHKFGDESLIRTYPEYSRSSYVFFRKGRLVVRIDSDTMGDATADETLKSAIRFAQLVAEQVSPPDDGARQ